MAKAQAVQRKIRMLTKSNERLEKKIAEWKKKLAGLTKHCIKVHQEAYANATNELSECKKNSERIVSRYNEMKKKNEDVASDELILLNEKVKKWENLTVDCAANYQNWLRSYKECMEDRNKSISLGENCPKDSEISAKEQETWKSKLDKVREEKDRCENEYDEAKKTRDKYKEVRQETRDKSRRL
ncbi:unnamed protein product [Gongylonema pulchrum]|uniref:DUF1311 domain-containing protein n=1 Tax=Gongylonema pulchrum TaxID=637853 RepID=A0A183DET8_9BILA|nr:unnamed protein product [Gongylonema pulchrum]